MDELDLAWLGGLLDGEGSVFVTRANNSRYALHLAVHMASYECVARAAGMWGVAARRASPTSTGKPMWQAIARHRVAASAIAAVLPYVTNERLRVRMQLGLDLQALKVPGGGGGVDHAYTERQRVAAAELAAA